MAKGNTWFRIKRDKMKAYGRTKRWSENPVTDARGFAPITQQRPTEVHGRHVVTVTPKTREVNGTRVVLKPRAQRKPVNMWAVA